MDLVRKILRKADAIPPIPAVITQVLELTSDPDFEMDNLVRIISVDPGITASVLRMANSAFFGLRYKASSLTQAIPQLGTQNLVEVALSCGVSHHFDSEQGGYKLPRGQLWRHSMATALIATHLASYLRLPNRATIYTAGLLHDMGKLVLSSFVGEVLDQIDHLVNQEGWYLHDAEKRCLGVDHAAIGGYLAKRWRLSAPVIKAIFFHHEPDRDKKPRTVTNAVSISNYLAKVCGVDSGIGLEQPSPPKTALLELEVYPAQLDELTDEMDRLLERAEPLLNLA